MELNKRIKHQYLAAWLVPVVLSVLTSTSLAQGTWTRKADLNVARVAPATCALNGKIYVFGGSEICRDCSDKKISSVVEEYDPNTDTWTVKTSMPTARTNPAASAVNGKIYVIGGNPFDFRGGLKNVEEYDPVTDTWTTKTKMPTARGALSTSVVDGKIYAIGGWRSSAVEKYDPASDTWEVLPDSMFTPRGFLTGTLVDGIIYILGGVSYDNYYTLQSVEAYDPATNTWAKKADMPIKRQNFSAATVNGIIYTVGGSSRPEGEGSSHTLRYNPTTDTWAHDTDMLSDRVLLHTSVVNGKIYAIGGSTTGNPFNAVAIVEEFTPDPDITGVEASSRENNKPAGFALHQNYPNPFNPQTHIQYEVSSPARVVLKIMNLLGQEIRTLVNEGKPAGNYEVVWDGRDAAGQRVASGVYLYRFEAAGLVQTRKMVLLQ